VTSVLDSQRIELNDSSDNSFLVSEQSGIKVLKDSFSNNHMHKIYNGQVETMVITDYLPFGYPSTHSHILVPYITNVSDAVVSNQTILTVGSSELIYTSYNNGVNWSLVANLNNYLEWNEEVEGISRATINNSQIIVGTTNGQIFSNTANGQLNIPLEKPL
jgi:hypothetical protein